MIRYTCAYYERPDMTLDEAQEAPFKLEKKDGLRNELLYSFELMYTVSIEYLEILYIYILYSYTHHVLDLTTSVGIKKRTCENFVLHLA